jgi:hypothetical protein
VHDTTTLERANFSPNSELGRCGDIARLDDVGASRDAVDWLLLKVAAMVFLSQLAKEAATDVYRNKAAIARALRDTRCATVRSGRRVRKATIHRVIATLSKTLT